jgi:hypothetical protein
MSCALDDVTELFLILESGVAAHLGVGSGAEALGQTRSDLQLQRSRGEAQGLQVGVARDVLDAAQARRDHSVDGVGAASADSDDLDGRGRRVAPLQLDRETMLRLLVGLELDHLPFPPSLHFFAPQKKSRKARATELVIRESPSDRRRFGFCRWP